MNTSEVQYERLRPKAIAAAREACPVAWLPIGTIEWHGVHNPIGLDTLKAHALAIRCAESIGGLVFPPLYYGESREEGLIEANDSQRGQVAEIMGLPSENFAPGYMRFTPQEQYEHYQHLLLHNLIQLKSLGFKVLVLVAGHYPLLDHARSACAMFHQMRWSNRRAGAIAWTFTGYELVRDLFNEPGDHAGHWETSLALALFPELVEMNELPTDRAVPPTAVYSQAGHDVRDATAEYGKKAIDAIVERVGVQVRDRLEHPDQHYGHGWKA